MKIKNKEGATALSDTSGLIPKHISTVRDLNEWEAQNILKATSKFVYGSRPSKKGWLTLGFIKKVHKQMFDESWRWAGQFRTTNTNQGIDWHQISEEVKKLCDDCKVWKIDHENDAVSNAVMLHQRLTRIHPFLNGNGRHARLLADIYLYYNHYPILLWGVCSLHKRDDVRKEYLKALKSADQGDFDSLIQFARSTSK